MINISLRAILNGLLSYTPLWHLKKKETGGTYSARYCYSVWLRHISYVYENGLASFPNVIAELGPGDSLGIGIAGLITGANKYYALDVVNYAKIEENLKILDELIKLFRKREDIPGEKEFPKIKPYLKSYRFPHRIFSDSYLNACLKPDRIRAIKDAIVHSTNKAIHSGAISIKYFVPWADANIIEKESVDMIYSQAVMEHVEDSNKAYSAMYRWLKPNGYMSHEIDYKCHGTAKKWNGHWAYPDFVWKIIKGKRPYLINRLPHSIHVDLQRKNCFQIISELPIKNTSGIERKSLVPQFENISEDDFTTSSAYIISLKRQ